MAEEEAVQNPGRLIFINKTKFENERLPSRLKANKASPNTSQKKEIRLVRNASKRQVH